MSGIGPKAEVDDQALLGFDPGCLTHLWKLRQLDDAKAGYRFFGFDDVVVVLTDAKALVESGAELDSFDAEFDRRYSALANYSVLFDRFAAHLAGTPPDFSPRSV